MRRREFLAGVGYAAAWPVVARAQQRALPVIGILGGGSRSAFDFAVSALAQGLRQQGFVEDRNVSIQYSWADGHYDLLASMAAEFVRRRVSVIVDFARHRDSRSCESCDLDHSDCLYARNGPGRRRSCQESQPARNQLDRLD